jgi:hypothetical protein
MANESDRIQETFDTYMQAILNNRGVLAYSVVDQSTKKYWEELFHKVIYSNKNEILEYRLADKFTITLARHLTPHAQLLAMNGQTFFEYAVNQGWVGKNSVSKLSLGDLGVSGNFAIGKAVVQGKIAPFHWHFYKEEGSWKIDLTEMLKIGEVSFIHLQKKSGKTEEAFIFNLVEIISRKSINSETIYLPPARTLKEPISLPRDT